ncbi:MAG: flagellar biosynthesis protein FlhB [Synergistetes bacterium]|nr:flagellar biosynthesis protein FlhB [Synergistota bacterium]MDW8193047.1 flagellar biosynthesis protein FlhB [Synergistota bacterium]
MGFPRELKRCYFISGRFDLQLFAEEKTEPATPRRRRRVREEGQVARSAELNAFVIISVGLLSLLLFEELLREDIFSMTRYIFSNLHLTRLSGINLDNAIRGQSEILRFFLKIISPFFLFSLVGAIAVNIFQVGFHLTFKPLAFNLNRLNPVVGLGRIFSLRSLVELIKGSVKAILVGYLLYRFIKADYPAYLDSLLVPFPNNLIMISKLIFFTLLKVLPLLLILAIIDYTYQKWEFERSIRMSKYEIKEEYKQVEGDPRVRAKIREKQRELARRRMMQEVPKAQVVITNPVMVAVALRYDPEIMNAPIVVAKGERLIAERIKRIAEEHGIPIVEDKALAWTLYKTVDVGDEIPPELYKAVAEVLAFVYRLGKEVA